MLISPAFLPTELRSLARGLVQGVKGESQHRFCLHKVCQKQDILLMAASLFPRAPRCKGPWALDYVASPMHSCVGMVVLVGGVEILQARSGWVGVVCWRENGRGEGGATRSLHKQSNHCAQHPHRMVKRI